MILCVCLPSALECGPNSNYSTCMTPCPASCADLAAPSECEQTVCVEGCQCAPGFALSENDCVPFNQCGCTYLGRYYTVSLSMRVRYDQLKMKKWGRHCTRWSSFSIIFYTAWGDVCDRGLFTELWMYCHWCCVPTKGLWRHGGLHCVWHQTWLL